MTEVVNGRSAMRHWQLAYWDKLFRSIVVIFFNFIYFGALRTGHMPVDDRGDLYSHAFTSSHIVRNIQQK